MSKIEELRAMLKRSNLTLPIQCVDRTFLTDAESELICDTEAANQDELDLIVTAVNTLPALFEAVALVSRARSLIDEAMNVHIYDVDNGDVPDADCPYQAFLNDAKPLLKDLK